MMSLGRGSLGVPGPDGHDGTLRALMDAVVAASSDLDIETVLRRVAVAACDLTGARYGALGVLGPHGGLREFVHHGVDDRTRERIGHLPTGRGVLGQLVDDPRPLRLHDLSTHPRSVGFPAHHPPMRTFLGVSVHAHGEVYGNLYLADKTSRTGEVVDFTVDDEAVVVALASAAGVAVDHAHAYRRVRDHERWLEAAAACTRLLTRGPAAGTALDEVLGIAQAAAGAPAGALLTDPAEIPPALADAARSAVPAVQPLADGTAVGLPGAAWALLVGLRSGDRRLGHLALTWSREDGRSAPDVDRGMVAGFAEQVSLALDVAAAQADRARLAVLEDRDRIARDLHDMVIQRLFAVGLDLQGVAQDAVRPDVADRLVQAVDDLDDTIKDVRSSIFRLTPRAGPGVGSLHARVNAEVSRARELLGFLPRLRTEGATASVPAEVADDVVAVVREALANTARHASARSALVEVLAGADLTIRVVDDGVGVDERGARRSGLRNLERRAAEHGGTLTLAAGPQGGTSLTWTVPVSGGPHTDAQGARPGDARQTSAVPGPP